MATGLMHFLDHSFGENFSFGMIPWGWGGVDFVGSDEDDDSTARVDARKNHVFF